MLVQLIAERGRERRDENDLLASLAVCSNGCGRRRGGNQGGRRLWRGREAEGTAVCSDSLTHSEAVDRARTLRLEY